MTKKLTASDLNKLSSQFNEKKKIYIMDGQYEVNIYTKFRDSGIDNVILNYVGVLDKLRKKPELDDIDLRNTVGLLNTFVLREFSDLPIPRKNDVSTLVKVSLNLMDSGIMQEVFKHLPADQIERVQNKLKATATNIGSVLGELAITSSVASGDSGNAII